MNDLDWIRTASNHAVITKSELMQWLGVRNDELRRMVNQERFPRPRFGGFRRTTSCSADWLTTSCRWRVGDVRAWLSGSEARMQFEAHVEIAAESTKSKAAREHHTLSCGGPNSEPR